jgi:hypothetical protein
LKAKHTVDEVFGITRNLPLNYVARTAVDDKLRAELAAGHHVVIYGSSKQGKTSLRKRCMADQQYILIQCSNKSDVADLHSSILKRAGFEVTQSTKKSASGKNKIAASFKLGLKAAILGNGAQMEAATAAERETTKTTEVVMSTLELDIDDVNDVIAALRSIDFKK